MHWRKRWDLFSVNLSSILVYIKNIAKRVLKIQIPYPNPTLTGSDAFERASYIFRRKKPSSQQLISFTHISIAYKLNPKISNITLLYLAVFPRSC